MFINSRPRSVRCVKLIQVIERIIPCLNNADHREKTVAGAKYPHLCRFAEHLFVGRGDSLRIISVERDINASIESQQNRS
ncbi:MAG TPA: hypothetical protein PLR25_08795, partial [Planctomycetaceae bacterium]|nr:hypothetical protein [Planctomycetaceae bacterium]